MLMKLIIVSEAVPETLIRYLSYNASVSVKSTSKAQSFTVLYMYVNLYRTGNSLTPGPVTTLFFSYLFDQFGFNMDIVNCGEFRQN